jgi:hypothetical protein
MKAVAFWSFITAGIILCSLLRKASGHEASPMLVTGVLIVGALTLIAAICRKHS